MKTPKGISDAYKNVVGTSSTASRKEAPIKGGTSNPIKKLDDLFSYQGVKYQDMPSYQYGGGGGKSLDRLAQMMGGQIYNPNQYARMTSQGSASGEFPYKSTLSAQEAAAQAGLQKMRGEQERGLQALRGEQEKGLQQDRFKIEADIRKQQQISSVRDAMRSVRRGSPEYFDLQMELAQLER